MDGLRESQFLADAGRPVDDAVVDEVGVDRGVARGRQDLGGIDRRRVAELHAVQGRQAAAGAEVRLAAEDRRVGGKEDDRIAADVERAADARATALVELAGLRRVADDKLAGCGHRSIPGNGPLDLSRRPARSRRQPE